MVEHEVKPLPEAEPKAVANDWYRSSSGWLRGFALFALLVAVPFLLERLLGRHPRMPVGGIKVSDSFWQDVLSYSGFGIVVLLLLGFLIVLAIFLPQTYQISCWLSITEREMNRMKETENRHMTAFLLHQLYEGDVKTAQLRIYGEFKNGGKPFIAPGLRELLVPYQRTLVISRTESDSGENHSVRC